jgi:hypothetical protein
MLLNSLIEVSWLIMRVGTSQTTDFYLLAIDGELLDTIVYERENIIVFCVA